MKNHGLRRVFSLLLALFMVFTLLPTAAFAEDTTEPKPVVVEEGQQEPKQEEVKQPEGETPEEPKDEVKQPEGEAPAKVETPADGNTPAPSTDSGDGNTPTATTGLSKAPIVTYAKKTIPITVKVQDSAGNEYTVGSAEARQNDIGMYSYTIPDLSRFVSYNTFNSVSKVKGDWYLGTEWVPFKVGEKVRWYSWEDDGYITYYVDRYTPADDTSDSHWLRNFKLTYDGGEDAANVPEAQTYRTNKSSETTHTFTISSTAPTREGYIFKGWSETAGGSVVYQLGDNIDVTGSTTLYAVWEKATPPTPDKPHTPTGGDLGDLGNTFVVVKCISNDAHAESMCVAIPNSCSFTEPELIAGKYTSTVTVTAEPYVNAYSQTNGAHTLDDEPTKSIALTWDSEGKVWTVAEGAIPIAFKVKCKTEIVPPAKPEYSELLLLDTLAGVTCDDREKVTTKPYHKSLGYRLNKDSYTLGQVTLGDDDVYTCDLTIYAEQFVEKYSETYGNHRLADNEKASKTLTLSWSKETKKWSVETIRNDGWYYALFHVTCQEAPQPQYIKVKVHTQSGEKVYDGTPLTKPELVDDGIDATLVYSNGTEKALNVALGGDKDSIYYADLYLGDDDAAKADQDSYAILMLTVTGSQTGVGESKNTYQVSEHSQLNVGNKLTGLTVGDNTVYVRYDDSALGTLKVTDAQTYTVTYTDGMGGMWFTNEVHSGLKTGDPTPKYNNGVNPIREGYDFKGWLPEVAENVTENAKYEAQWESKSEMLIKELLGKIKVECVSDSSHTAKEYDTSVGGFSAITLEKEKGKFTSTISVDAKRYVERYNDDTGKTHQLVAGTAETQTIVVEFDSSYDVKTAKVTSGTLPVVFKVKCKDEVVPPTEPTLDELRNLLGQVTVDCTNANANHPDKEYDLIKGSYTATGDEHSGAYICAIGVIADKYVEAYNKDYPGHKLAGSTNFDKVKMVYLTRVETGTGYEWKLSHTPSEPEALIFKVVCEDVPAETFTVTYTDGVKNKVIFKDDVHENLAYGTATPKFTGGTPKRTGYTFTGWKPKVADTVTGNVTYVAQWKSNSGKDNVPKTGDGEIVMTLSSVLLLSFCGAAAVCVFDRKRKHF